MSKPLTYQDVLYLIDHPAAWYPDENEWFLQVKDALRLAEFMKAQQAQIEALEAQLAKPQIAAKIGGQAFQIPPHDQAPTLSSEVLAVSEILEGEDDGES